MKIFISLINKKTINFNFNINIYYIYACFFLILFNTNYVRPDLPGHCLVSQIEGEWTVYMGYNHFTSETIGCGHNRPDTNLDHVYNDPKKLLKVYQTTTIYLERPNIVYDKDKKTVIGKWTMIFDEGFEFSIYNKIYFAFSRYIMGDNTIPTNKDNLDTSGYVSLCNQTFIGWYHDQLTNSNWGCYYAIKYDSLNNANWNINNNTNESKESNSDYNLDTNKNSLYNNDGKNLSGIVTHKSADLDDGRISSNKQNSLTKLEKITKDQEDKKLLEFSKIYESNNNENKPRPYTDIYKGYFIETEMYINDYNEKEPKTIDKNNNGNLFIHDYNFINKINNNSKSLWKAKAHDIFKGKSNSYMLNLLGENNISKKYIHELYKKNRTSSKFNNKLANSFYRKYLSNTNISSKINRNKHISKNYSFLESSLSSLLYNNSQINTSVLDKINQDNNVREYNLNTSSDKNTVVESDIIEGSTQTVTTSPPKKVTNNANKDSSYYNLPLAFDWRDIGGINFDSPVRKQGECGSCYVISTLSVMESRIRIMTKYKKKPILSVTSVLSCSRYNQGCNGGYPYLVGKYGKEYGFVDDSCSPYTEKDDICKIECFSKNDSFNDLLNNNNNNSSNFVRSSEGDEINKNIKNLNKISNMYRVSDYGYIGDYYGGCNEEKMMTEIYNNGPIVVAINASSDLYYYNKGIFTSDEIRKEGEYDKKVKEWEYTNHAVVCVGWGEDIIDGEKVKYWILKNSWGDDWGENGYFKTKRGVNMISIEAQGFYITPLI